MKISRFKIDLEIFIVFLVVIGISVFNVLFSTSNISRNQFFVNQIMSTEIPSLQKLEEMRLVVNQSVMYTTRCVYLPDSKEDKLKYDVLTNFDYPRLKVNLKTLSEKWDSKTERNNLNKNLTAFDELLIEQKYVISKIYNFDDFENPEIHFRAEEALENRIIPHSKKLIEQLNNVIFQKQTQVDILHGKIESSYGSMLFGIQTVAILIILTIVIASYYVSMRMIIPIMRLKNNILQMGRGEIPAIRKAKKKNAVGLMTDAVSSLAESLKKTTRFAHKIGGGNLSAEFTPLSKNDELGNALLQMRDSLRVADEETKKRMAFSHFTEKINRALRENMEDLDDLSDKVISILVKSLNAYQGGIYFIDDLFDSDENVIRLHGSYALDGIKNGKQVLAKKEGLIGQVIKDGEMIYLRNATNNKKLIYSGFSSFSPSHVLIVPLKHQDKIFGAAEISGFTEFKDFEIEFVKGIGETIGTTISNVKANSLTRQLLAATREQASKLIIQEEELRNANNELSNQSKLLQASEEELMQSNKELKQKARELQQKNEVNEQARETLILKTKELEEINKYKSEFLANMSHELRTPLNSLLILAKLLEENKEHNLTEKQKEYASVILKSGKNLLTLINDILDLSKMEAGKMQIIPENTEIHSIGTDIKMLFEELAAEKKIKFEVLVDPGLPAYFVSDKVRIEQVIKNLLSNAFKFTPSGGKVIFEIKRAGEIKFRHNSNLEYAQQIIEFTVRDTGIGIPADKQKLIFEAFQQADGSISRSYGGTGLGLSISKMLVGMLGGEIRLTSKEGSGSEFSFFLSEDYFTEAGSKISDGEIVTIHSGNDESSHNARVEAYCDDREMINADDRVILIVEDNPEFAREILNKAHEKNFKGIIAENCSKGLTYAKYYRPAAIICDTQFESPEHYTALDEFRQNNDFAGIPVHLINNSQPNTRPDGTVSAVIKKPIDNEDIEKAFSEVALSLSTEVKKVLLLEDSDIDRDIVYHLLHSRFNNLEIVSCKNIPDAVKITGESVFDLVVMDLDLGNGFEEGLDFLDELRAGDRYARTPVVVFTGREPDPVLENRISSASASMVNKNSSSLEQLLEETELFLYSLSQENNEIELPPQSSQNILSGKRILMLGNDMRNIYTVSKELNSRDMIVNIVSDQTEYERNITNSISADIILIDINFEAIDPVKSIRDLRSRHQHIPIIALIPRTGFKDREKIILNGVSDFAEKPIDSKKLISLLNIWLYKE